MKPLIARVDPRWPGATCVVAGSGPSLTEQVANACKAVHCIAVNDAWRLLPWAEVLYACDEPWWNEYDGALGFAGERWSSHNELKDDKLKCAAKWNINIVRGERQRGFSTDPTILHYGDNSGFQAINLAIHFGCIRILLIGFDMRIVNGKRHFFGQHPKELRNTDPEVFIPNYIIASQRMPPGVSIINCTPNSKLTCFPMSNLGVELAR